MSTVPARPRLLHPLAAQSRAIASLPPLATPFASGAVPLQPDTRLNDMAALSSVKAQLQAGAQAEPYSLEQYVKGVYDQSTANDPYDYTCVPYSTAAMISVYCQEAYGRWIIFDAEDCYRAVGGTGSHGVSGTGVLQWAQETGFLDKATGQRHKISSSGYQDPTTDDGRDALKAAIAANNPCVIGLHLPDDFNDQVGRDGACQSTTLTQAYHQVCMFGYDDQRFYFLNSQGDGWGTHGKGSILWSVLDAPEQVGIAYAATATDTTEHGVSPLYKPGVIAPRRANSAAP